MLFDPFIYWQSKKSAYPILSKLADSFNSTSATNVAYWYFFSVARDVYDYRLSNLSPNKAEMYTLIYVTLPKITSSYYIV
jgi:hypothetical protein